MANKSFWEQLSGWFTIADVLGKGPTVLIAAAGIGTTVWSLATHLPGPVVLASSLAVIAGLTVIVGYVRRARFGKREVAAAPLTQVRDQVFKDTEVVLDGRDFINCEFYDTNLLFGGGMYASSGSKFGNVGVKPTNVTVAQTLKLLGELGLFAPHVKSMTMFRLDHPIK